MLESKIKRVFTSNFGTTPDVIAKAPGRINIIGEHTDYNLGYVLPAAIDHYMYIGLIKNHTNTFNIYSVDYDINTSFQIDQIAPSDLSWLNLIKGVVDQLKDRIAGFDLVFCGDIPEGAGLSSSAALCCGTAFAISNLFDLNLEKWDIAKIAQKSEHTYAKVQCGIMDQFASMFGMTNHVLMLDCLTLTYKALEIDISGHQFILLDSNVKHQLNESEYNARSTESADALKRLKSMNDEIETFRDVKLDFLDELKEDHIWWKRAHHIVSENERVLALSSALEEHNMESVGRLLNEGHLSQRNDYEITCAETDFLVDVLNQEDIMLGARQVGGGFGGCILGIVRDQGINGMIARVNYQYQKEFGKQINKIPIRISKGCHLLTSEV